MSFNTNALALELHLSPQGKPDAPATRERPLQTLEQARDRIRLQREDGVPVTVWLHEGDYELRESFVLSEEDSGTAEAPVYYRAWPNATARLLGSRNVTGWRPVSCPDMRRRFPQSVRGEVMEVDLKANGISGYGELHSRGFKRSGVIPAGMELIFNGEVMTLARWPNRGEFVKIAGFPEAHATRSSHGHPKGALEGGFHYEDDRPSTWERPDEVWMHGYWMFDWADTHERVKRIDPETRLIETAPPHGEYGFRTGQRYYYYNIPEELDEPGEWYADRENGMLYFLPPAPVEEAEVMVSTLDAPLMDIRDARHVIVKDLHFMGGRGIAVSVAGGGGVILDSCTIRNSGTMGIRIMDGTSHQIRGCTVSHTGEEAMNVQGGDMETLEPGNHQVIGNHLHNMGRWSRSYRPGILMRGVGNRIAHNLIHDGPHSGISFRGVDLLIEYNEIHSVCRESGDVGAIYTGRSWTARGNVIRHNYIHQLGGRGGHGSMAIYLDDMASGFTVYGNIIHNAQHGVYIGGGRDNRVENNLFINMERRPVHVDGRGISPIAHWRRMVHARIKTELFEILESSPVYAERFPDLVRIRELYEREEGFIGPEGTVIRGNVIVDDTPIHLPVEEAAKGMVEVGRNLIGVDPGMVDPDRGDFRFKEDSPAWEIGFQPLPQNKTGLSGYIRP
ncbi:MAG: right-handed parallel beta-helix repeat-containing protein [Verrucomicrobia bacterium]|nr:right-handed parallel beta-helix repeat-containing protein [Verrucomicrobiota bacterium]MCH8526994.1 right-handed parallel beta-helix repeat-containing protein [Kiritimatiellia bacterium]